MKKKCIFYLIMILFLTLSCQKIIRKSDSAAPKVPVTSSPSLVTTAIRMPTTTSSLAHVTSAAQGPTLTPFSVSPIVGKWRCIHDLNDSLAQNSNSIYIFRNNNSGFHITFRYLDGKGNLEKFSWHTVESGNKKSIRLNYFDRTNEYFYSFDDNKVIFNDGNLATITLINIYNNNTDYTVFPKDVEPNDDNDIANNIPVDGTPVYGKLTPGDADCFTFTGQVGYNYYVNIDYLTGVNNNLCINWFKYINYGEEGYYWVNFGTVNTNGLNLGEYDNLRLSGSGNVKCSIRVSDQNKQKCTYLISIIEQVKQ